MKFLIFKRNGEEIGEKLNSYESSFKDDTSNNRPEDQAEPKAIHLELPESLDENCVKVEWKELEAAYILTLREPIEAQDEILDENDEVIQPAIEAQDGLYQEMPAVFGWGLSVDEDKLAAKVAYQAEAPRRYVKGIIEAAKAFGDNLMNDFITDNVMLGITQDGMTNHVRKTMSEVISACATGSLRDAIAEAKAIPEEAKDIKYITDARLLSFVNKIETYLEVPLSTDLE